MLVDFDEDGGCTVSAHVANNNELLRDFASGTPGLIVFRAEDSYVSPNWYPTKALTHRHVPTWNYQAVHVSGAVEYVTDSKFVLNVIGRLTKLHETRIDEEKPWKMSDAPRDYMEAQLSAITGIRMRATGIVAKSKLSQNRDTIDYETVRAKVDGLGKSFIHRQMSKL